MFRVDINNQIFLTRGDTAELSVSIEDLNGERYQPQEADTLTLTLKNSINDNEIVLQKIANGTNNFVFTPEDTQSLDFKKYVYDIQLTMHNGKVYTVVNPTFFCICEEVTL